MSTEHDTLEGFAPYEKAALEMSPSERGRWTAEFLKHPMRGILAIELKKAMQEKRLSLENIEAEDLKEAQGIIKGLKVAHGILQRIK